MKLAILADQHGSLPPIPACDLLILSGDVTGGNPYGPRDDSDPRWHEWLAGPFLDWLKGAPPDVVLIAGNHDTAIERFRLPESVAYRTQWLCDWSITVAGLRIYGTPWTRTYGNLAFELPEHELAKKWAMIPEGIDILICHQPPHGYGDFIPGTGHVGSPSLTEAIRRVKPRLVACGHIHEGRGVYKMGETTIVNAACGFMEVEL